MDKYLGSVTIQRGATLLEILIALVLIGMMVSLAIPLFRTKSPAQAREEFVTRVNSLLYNTLQRALMMRTLHRVKWDITRRIVSIEQHVPDDNSSFAQQFKPLPPSVFTLLSIPLSYEIKEFSIEGVDEIRKGHGPTTKEVWFYITPQGIAQDVVIKLLDHSDKQDKKSTQFDLVMNPFNSQMKMN